MGRTYAGILGPLAMTVVIVRGVVDGAGVEGTLTLAIVHLFAFALVGLIVGYIAQMTIDAAVRQQLQQQLEAEVGSAG